MSFTYGLDDPTPTWARGSSLTRKWVEDDACRAAGDQTREHLHEAWERLYGEPLPKKEDAVESVDQGDCMLWLFPGGRVYQHSFDGDSIYELAIELPEGTRSRAALDWAEVLIERDREEKEDEPRPDLDDAFRRTPTEERQAKPPPSPYSVDGRDLSPDQVQSLEDLLDAVDAGQKVIVLTGAAGTGKTTLARALEEELNERGWSVEYMAPTGKAAVRISEVVKRNATTIHSRLFSRVTNTEDGIPVFLEPKQLSDGYRRTAYICDEGSMVGSRLHALILKHLGPNAIIIYLADPYQLPPVADSWGPDLENPTSELTQIHRQAEASPVLQVASLLRRGEAMPKQSIGTGYQRWDGTLETAAKWMVEQLQAGEDAIVLCYSNKTRQKINSLVRYLMGYKQRGPLCLDEQLVVLRNNKTVGRMNGETMTAEEIRWFRTEKEGVVRVKSGDTQFFTMPHLIGESREAFEYHSKMAENRLGTEQRCWLYLDYAYCLTVHKSQGSEYRKVLFVIDRTMRYMWGEGKLNDGFRICYTAATRAREQLIVLDAR